MSFDDTIHAFLTSSLVHDLSKIANDRAIALYPD